MEGNQRWKCEWEPTGRRMSFVNDFETSPGHGHASCRICFFGGCLRPSGRLNHILILFLSCA